MGKQGLVLVAGMHRSGTSAVTRMLNLLGLSIGGAESLMTPQPDNPRGFWERADVSALNERLLRALGGSWDRPPKLWPGWGSAPALGPWREEARRMLECIREDGAPAHVIKDPRMSITLPLWLEVADGARVVLPIRDPIAVVQSLRHRNGFTAQDSASLWITYVASVLKTAPDALLVDYKDLLREPSAVAKRLSRALGLDGLAPEEFDRAANSIDPTLDHVERRSEPRGLEIRQASEIYRGVVGPTTGSATGPASPLITGLGRVTRESPIDQMDELPKLVLHIGAETTGTTSIQACLRENEDLLREAGILYPRSIGIRQHWTLAMYALDDDRPHPMTRGMPDVYRSDRPAWREKVARKLAREIGSARAAHVVISSEHFQSQLRTESEVARLHDLLAPLVSSVRVVCYLRRQDRALLSRHSAALRAGAFQQHPFNENAISPIWDYSELLQRWSAIFGEEAIVPRIYEEVATSGHGLISDFALSGRLPIDPHSLTKPGRENEALSSAAQAALRAFNRPAQDLLTEDQRRRVRRVAARFAADTFPGTPSMPARDDARQVVSKFADSNRRVSERWFQRDQLFDNDFSVYPEQPSLGAPVPDDQLMRFAVAVLAEALNA